MADVGKLRRSGLVSTFGPGALVDFREGGAAVSGVVAGLEEWDRNFGPAGVAHPQSTYEPRLMQKLQRKGHAISGFRLPPVMADQDLKKHRERLVAAEFPRWHQCPRCNRIGPSGLWAQPVNRAALQCPECDEGHPVYAVPVRFIMTCEQGHLQDFPWHYWVDHSSGCKGRNGFLFLKPQRAGLAGLFVSCPVCKASRSLEGIFSEKTWSAMKMKCDGLRPWLAGADEKDCPETPRAMQRGATNLYFPVTESSLDIPPWSDRLQADLGQFWAPIAAVKDRQQRRDFVRTLGMTVLQQTLQAHGWTVDRLVDEIEVRLDNLEDTADEDLRVAEYRQFRQGQDTPRDQATQFEIRGETVPQEIRPWISRTVRAVRLREVRALTGFTRIYPPEDPESKRISRLSVGAVGWLPAIEVFGEGIFLDLDRDRLKAWEAIEAVQARAAVVSQLWSEEYKARFEADPKWTPSARFLLVHTLAHAVMRQLSLDCGYSTAALRERLYVDDGDPGMAGLLIYTSTTDADGTLGGLQRQGTPALIRRTIPAALHAMEWCSSDPLCIEGYMAAPEAASGAACHACVLAPETACEHFNRMLDRALLVGTPDSPEVGYFKDLLG